MRGTARENRVVIYLENEAYERLKKRADGEKRSPNLEAKEMLLRGVADEGDGILQALNFLAEKVSELTQEQTTTKDEVKQLRADMARLRAEIGEDFQGLAQVINQ